MIVGVVHWPILRNTVANTSHWIEKVRLNAYAKPLELLVRYRAKTREPLNRTMSIIITWDTAFLITNTPFGARITFFTILIKIWNLCSRSTDTFFYSRDNLQYKVRTVTFTLKILLNIRVLAIPQSVLNISVGTRITSNPPIVALTIFRTNTRSLILFCWISARTNRSHRRIDHDVPQRILARDAPTWIAYTPRRALMAYICSLVEIEEFWRYITHAVADSY